jgi:hypothetical protein
VGGMPIPPFRQVLCLWLPGLSYRPPPSRVDSSAIDESAPWIKEYPNVATSVQAETPGFDFACAYVYNVPTLPHA